MAALRTLKEKREKHLLNIRNGVAHLPQVLENFNVQKITLATLYMGEGGKTRRSSLMFGNSDPLLIRMFLELLRHCYKIEETKFRCTVQCRADQDTRQLERFWAQTTGIPFTQFYKTRIDPRTIGKPSRKLDYKGVCRIEYFSADLYNELKIIASVLTENV